MRKKQSKEIEVREEKVFFFCKCGDYKEETILVSNGVGIVDTVCEKCKERVVFLYSSEEANI